MKKIVIVVFILCFSAIGFLIGRLTNPPPNEINSGVASMSREEKEEGSLIDPLLDCEVQSDLSRIELKTFKEEIEEVVSKEINANRAREIGFYFRSLHDGPWFGVYEDLKFFPASLVKIPVMITIFKKSESDPKLLAEKLNYDESMDDNNLLQYYHPKGLIEPGKSYTVEELVEKMITLSDNNAYVILLEKIGFSELKKTFSNFGLSLPDYKEGEIVHSVHDYASFFRILYNASYLEKQSSRKALKILTKTEFKDGLVAGVPKNIVIAHKFGIYEMHGEKQIHDCGIVYYPKNPYLLCIMTRGNDFNSLARVIQELSKNEYRHVNLQLKK